MRKNLLTTSAAALALLSIVGCSSGSADGADGASGAEEWPEEITISLVPSVEGEDLAEALDPLTAYLSDGLGIEVNGVVATDYAATVEALGADQAQVIITDAGSLYQATEQHGAELVLRDVRFGATSYASIAMTNNPEKYCEDEVVTATYGATGDELAYCNGTETGPEAAGEGPAGLEALAAIDGTVPVALQAATSPAGYQYPIVAMREQGVDTDALQQVPVEGNNNAVLAVQNGDAEVGFAYWDARPTVMEEAPTVGEDTVVFAYTEPIPNGGVAVSSSLPDDLAAELTTLMDDYADSSDEASEVMFDLVGLSDWTADTQPEQIARYGEILEQFAQ
ncbi:PhnD/SsuA/transferrin family substrate-binding protein [Brachybacterium saurashtrense]|uniref:Phosphate/phosphite/phosphonate ABC transporter substrate-binding protein n=1 Tax=Brachybacterium saurashtrense TaxID=556288 RepID=A0A345YPN4_9MICO|nr:PhnD/SsuA/transferrin family substrate-binding protein [Brachybacterium saurashtrense]AXK45886.1 phosphate/phosphite/phosphonate ABC transporter substrate-binding protein [Brachybacterium saurashtrense]RRR24905.1 phosphate/phosphite/phosphonate ABC transporter substrate-binding protein [Brachybacterium saurashtrense]